MTCNLIDAKTAKTAYPHRNDIYAHFWQYPSCKHFVGCHNGIKKRPLGCIPTPHIKYARSKLHEIIDPLWQKGKITRGDLYRKISEHLGWQYHTAELRTIEDCRKIWTFVKKLEKTLTGHILGIIDKPQDYIGQKVHVVDWHIGMVFYLKSIENGFFILETPKNKKIYKTKNQLAYLR
jgi:hypothetical protein